MSGLDITGHCKGRSMKNVSGMLFGVLGAVLLIVAALPGQSTASSAQEGDDDLRVMTYNIRHAQGNDDCEDAGTPEGTELEGTAEGTPEGTPSAAQCGVDLERTTDAIASLEADIVALQEVDRFWDRSGGVDQPTELVESLDVNACFGANLSHEADGHADKPHQYGTLILSAYPILSCDNTFLANQEGWEQRGLLEVRVEIEGLGEVAILNTHLQNTRDGEEDEAIRLRTEQAEAIAERIADLDVPVILMGDFNAEPDEEELASLQDLGSGLSVEDLPSLQDEESSSLQDAWQVAGDEDLEGYTYPASLDEDAERRIDVIFASSDFEVVSAEVPVDEDTLVASDHLPVVADLAPAEPREATPSVEADVTPEPTAAVDEAPATEPALIVAPTPEPVEEATPIQREEPEPTVQPTAPGTEEPEAQPTDEPDPTEELEPTEEPTAVIPEEPEAGPTEEPEPVEEAQPTEAPVPTAAPAPAPEEPAPTVEPAVGSSGEVPPAAAPPVEATVEPAGEAPGEPAGEPQGPPVEIPPAAEPQGPPVEIPPANG